LRPAAPKKQAAVALDGEGQIDQEDRRRAPGQPDRRADAVVGKRGGAMTTLQLSGTDIDGDKLSCTVPQFLLILQELAADAGLANLLWYGADMSPSSGKLERFGTQSASRIGTLDDLTGLFRSLSIKQLDFGILVAVTSAESSPPPTTLLSSEGEAGRRFDGSEIELIAYDNTYIEITSDRLDVLQRLVARFPMAKVIKSSAA
jgi:hypothetical protein